MRRLLLAPMLLALAAPVAAAPAVAAYVQAGTPTSMDVLWQAERPEPGRLVLFDAAGRTLRDERTPAATRHHLKLSGLRPGAGYGYAAYVGGVVAGTGSFRTNPGPEDGTFRFAVIGDSGSGNANQFAVAKQLTAWKPDFVLHVGDVIYEKGEAELYDSRFFAPYRALLGDTVFYPSPGNHDYGRKNLDGYEATFEAPRARPTDTERWYTFRYGHAQFFSLDSSMPFSAGSAQTKWLAGELAASTAKLKVAFFHHPPYSSGSHGSSLNLRKAWGPLFEQHDVQLVLTGHDHHYERIKPREDFAADGTPTTYVVTGGAGAWLRKVSPQAFTAASALEYHFVGFTAQGQQLTGEAIAKDGRIFDRFTIDLDRPGRKN